MTTLTDAIDGVTSRSINAARLMRSVEEHLLAEQAEAMWSLREAASAPADRSTDAQTEPHVDIGHADPTPLMASRIGWYSTQRNRLTKAIQSLQRDLDHLERVASAVIAVTPDQRVDDEPRCPGWNNELRAQLGGCGKIPETYRRNDGTTGHRELCAGCRKAQARHERETAAA